MEKGKMVDAMSQGQKGVSKGGRKGGAERDNGGMEATSEGGRRRGGDQSLSRSPVLPLSFSPSIACRTAERGGAGAALPDVGEGGALGVVSVLGRKLVEHRLLLVGNHKAPRPYCECDRPNERVCAAHSPREESLSCA